MELKLSTRDQILLSIIVAVLVMLGFGVLVLRPQISKISDVKKMQQEEQKKKQNAEATLKRLQDAKKQAAETEAKLIEVKKRLPEDPQLASFIVEIQDMANQAGINLVSITPEEMAQQKNYTNIPLKIHIEGDFFDIVDFLYRLQDLKRETRIDKVSISGKEWPTLAVDLEGSTFTLAKPITKTTDTEKKTTDTNTSTENKEQ